MALLRRAFLLSECHKGGYAGRCSHGETMRRMKAMTSRLRVIVAACLCLAALLTAGGVRADAIDGTWCFKDGRHMIIDGPNILIPGGLRLQGLYDRHGFEYTVPDGQPQAGTTITMSLIDDDTMTVYPGTAPMQTWLRCRLQTS